MIAQHSAALAGAWAGPPDDAPVRWTCLDQSDLGIFLTGQSITLDGEDLARLLASGDLAGELGYLLSDRGAALDWLTGRCPKRGEPLGEDDLLLFAPGVRCAVCGGPLRPMERGE